MIEDFLRAWRHVFKYVLGLIVAIELGALWIGPEFFRSLKPALTHLIYNEPNTLIVLTGLAITSVTGAIIAEMLFVVPFYLLEVASSVFIKRGWLGKKSKYPKLLWWELAFCPPGRAVQLAVESDKDYLIMALRVASLSNIAKDHTDKALELSSQDVRFFSEAVETFTASKNYDLLWWIHYALQFTQERRELDACQVEAANARSVVVAGVLALATVIRVRTLLLPEAVPLVAAFAVSSTIAASKAWLEAKQRMIYYMVGLILFAYSWSEQGDVEDREAI
jgi:hypothetical protein